jgi:hypothetical protein
MPKTILKGESIMSLGKITIRRAVPVTIAAVSLLAGTSLLASSAASAGATAHHGNGAGALVSSPVKPMSVKQTLAYWTPARMRAAKPVSVITVRPKANTGAVSARPAGKPGSVRGGFPGGATAAATATQHAASSITAFPYPYPYDIYQVPFKWYSQLGYRLNGKLFFSNDGGNYVCSATSVASKNGTALENEIWTAGHCAANTDGNHQWDSSAVFVPAYNGTKAVFDPYGEFVYTGAAETTSAWFNNGDFSEDEAAMSVSNSSTTGKTLGNAIGWAGFAWNQPVNEQFSSIGYPAASPFNGLTMYQDWGATANQDCFSGEANPVCPIAIGNPMTGGSSGGAWWIDWAPTSPNYINGHNDFKFSNEPNGMDSPYQDTLSNEVRCFGAASC